MTGQMLRVAAVTPLSPLVTRFRFEHPEGAALPLFSGGGACRGGNARSGHAAAQRLFADIGPYGWLGL